jgi:hypothetical protein
MSPLTLCFEPLLPFGFSSAMASGSVPRLALGLLKVIGLLSKILSAYSAYLEDGLSRIAMYGGAHMEKIQMFFVRTV